MSTRRHVKDPRWAEIKEDIRAACFAAANCLRKKKPNWALHGCYLRDVAMLERSLQEREAELDAVGDAEKGAAS